MGSSEFHLLANVAVGFGLTYALGFERQLRGSLAGDRTFALVGTAAAAITAVVHTTSPQAIAGIVTGIGFIGAGVVFRGRGGLVHGITTAATILMASAIGIVVGYGDLLLGLIVSAGILVLLEIPHLPFLRAVDARTYADRFANDFEIEAQVAPPLEPDGGHPLSQPASDEPGPS